MVMSKERKEFLEKLFEITIDDEGGETRQVTTALSKIRNYDIRLGLINVESQLKSINKSVEDVNKHIYGNGRAGLLERVSNLETTNKVLIGVITLAISALGVLVVVL